jgi:serine/threonine protein kinase
MNPEHSRRIQDLFDNAMQLAAADRAPFVAQACAGDTGLRDEVQDLLAYYLQVERDQFLPTPDRRAFPSQPSSGDARDAQSRTGTPPGYEILFELGRGGMGVVYKAVQTKLKRPVALKMVLLGAHAGPEVLARFRSEAEAVARLKHPNIVEIYDLNEHDGLPWFAMEFVNGGSLADRLRGTPQPVLESAQLVQTLARAMRHAHDLGIVHRDLKPANVLLQKHEGRSMKDAEPDEVSSPSSLILPISCFVPKIADFGLAKQLDLAQGPTLSGQIIGTPSYMAPEQAEGRPSHIGPATDVYALGTILYEMLTGRPPFKGDSPAETLRQVVLEDPVSVLKLQPRVPRDAETICFKCLQKDPTKRYADAGALAEDLERFLAGKPIRARPLGRIERVRRWSARNRLAAGLAATLAVVVVAGFALVVSQWQRAEDNYKRSEQSFSQARQAVNDLVITAERVLRSKSGTQPARTQLLAKALESFKGLYQQRPHDARTRFGLAYCYHVAGVVISETGNLDDALSDYREAADLLQDGRDDQISSLTWRNVQAANYLYTAFALCAVGRMEEALQFHDRADQIWQGLAREQSSESPRYQRNLALNLWAIAKVHLERDQFTDALTFLNKARTIQQKLHEENFTENDFLEQLAYNDHTMGVLHSRMNEADDARSFLEKALEARAQFVNADSGNIWRRCNLAKTELKLGVVYAILGERAKAHCSLRQARAVLEQLADQNKEVTEFQRNLAEVDVNLGKLQTEQQQYAEALASHEQARAACQKLRHDNPAVIQNRVILADSYTGIARVRKAQGQSPEALKAFEKAESVWLRLIHDHPDIPRFQADLAGVEKELAPLSAAKSAK